MTAGQDRSVALGKVALSAPGPARYQYDLRISHHFLISEYRWNTSGNTIFSMPILIRLGRAGRQ